jgi:general secretion pathway protein D
MKTTLLALLFTCAGLWAQSPRMGTNAPVPNAAARDEFLRRAAARRAAAAGNTNAAAQAGGITTNNPAAAGAPATPPAGQPPTPPPIPTPPGGPAATPPGSSEAAAAAPPANAPREELLPAGTINFPATPLDQVLTIYAELVNRTLLRPGNLPAATITLKTQTQLTKKEAIQAFDAVLALNGIAMIPIGEKFIKVVPNTQANQEGAPFSKLDARQLPDMGQYVTHVVQLKFLKPSEVVPVIQPFSKIPNAILPIETSQILVLRDYAENVKRMLEMIEQVDVAVPAEFVSEVIPMKYAKASDISSALSSLGGGGGGGGATSVGAHGSTSRTGTTGRTGVGMNGQMPGSTTQGTMQPGGAGGGAAGGAAGGAGGGTFTSRLNQIISRAAGTGEFQILGQTKIIADERTNSLLIFASRQDMEMIKSIIAKLDVVLAQVLIEAIIMEVSLDNSKSIGFSAAQEAKAFTPTIGGVGGYNNGQSFYGTGSSNLFPGNFTSILPTGAGQNFSYWGKINNYDLAVSAAASDSRITVLSRPRIQTSHAVEATIFVGSTVPFVTGTTFGAYGGTGSQSSYQNQQVGITLDVTPYINPDGLVVMDLKQTVSQLGTPVEIDGNQVPTTTERDANATVAVKDRDTIILGGFISTTKSKSKTGVPYLMNIPLLGSLFSSISDDNQRTELIVLIRPTVLPTPADAALVAAQERSKLPAVRRAEREIQDDDSQRLKQANRDLGTGAPDDSKRNDQGFMPWPQ